MNDPERTCAFSSPEGECFFPLLHKGEKPLTRPEIFGGKTPRPAVQLSNDLFKGKITICVPQLMAPKLELSEQEKEQERIASLQEYMCASYIPIE